MKCHACKIRIKARDRFIKMAYKKIYLCFNCYKADSQYFIKLSKRKLKKPKKSYSVPNYLRKIIFALYPNFCMACGCDKNLNIDHIIARSKGGTDELNNLQILCWNCNKKKSNRLFVDYRLTKFLSFRDIGINLANLLKAA